MGGTALQKQNEVSDDEVNPRFQPWTSEARRPLPRSTHPCTGDIILCPPEVEVVCHCANRHKLGNKGIDVVESWG